MTHNLDRLSQPEKPVCANCRKPWSWHRHGDNACLTGSSNWKYSSTSQYTPSEPIEAPVAGEDKRQGCCTHCDAAVAWLREQAKGHNALGTARARSVGKSYRIVADALERGEHLANLPPLDGGVLGAHPSDRAFVPAASSPSVSPVPASIPCASEMLSALKLVLQYREGRGRFRFVNLPPAERDCAMFDAWQEVEQVVHRAIASADRCPKGGDGEAGSIEDESAIDEVETPKSPHDTQMEG